MANTKKGKNKYMSANNNDKIFKMLAHKYTCSEGERLETEAHSEYVTSSELPQGLYENINNSIKNSNRGSNRSRAGRILRIASASAAAVLFIFVILGLFSEEITGSKGNNNPQMAPAASNDNISATLQTETPNKAWTAPEITVVSDRFSIADILEDNGSIIYVISDNIYGDNAVITVENADMLRADSEPLKTINKNGVYYYSDYGYNMVAYNVGAASMQSTISLSCKYSGNTIKELMNHIHIA